MEIIQNSDIRSNENANKDAIIDYESVKSWIFCSCDTGLIALMETTINQIAKIEIQLGYGRIGIEVQDQISE